MPSIYVFRMEGTDLYKIGVTSTSVLDRLSACQTGNPLKLSIEVVLPVSSRDDERDLHEMFSEHRLQGEWFRLSPDDIGMLINRINTYYEIGRMVRRDFENH